MPEKNRHLSKKELKTLRSQERRVQEAKEISRRDLLKRLYLAGGSALGLGITGAVWHLGSKLLSKEKPQEEKPLSFEQVGEQHKRDEVILQKAIEQSDQTMSALETSLATKASEQLMIPFEVYNINKANPNRNSYSFLLTDLAERGPDALKSPKSLYQADRRFFFIRLLEGRVNVAGTFNPSARTIHLSESISSTNLFDALVIYHEIEHARQDLFIRQHLTTQGLMDRYIAFYSASPGSKPRILIEFEYQAYAKEIEASNLLSNGRLKADATSAVADTNYYLQLFNARSDQRSAVEALVLLSKAYYQSGSIIDTYATGFQQSLNNVYRDQGYTLYRLTNPSNFEVRLLP